LQPSIIDIKFWHKQSAKCKKMHLVGKDLPHPWLLSSQNQCCLLLRIPGWRGEFKTNKNQTIYAKIQVVCPGGS